MTVSVNGSPSFGGSHAWIAGISFLLNAWTSIIDQVRRSCSLLATTVLVPERRFSPRSPSATLSVQTVIASGQLNVSVRAHSFLVKNSGHQVELDGSRGKGCPTKQLQIAPTTNSRNRLRASATSLRFGAIKGPGASARKYTRSCRCTLARRHGGGASVLAHTNVPVMVRTARPIVTGLRLPALVSRHSLPSMTANSTGLCARDEFLCGTREMPTLACGHGAASPIGGSGTSCQFVLSSMTPDSRSSGPHRRGINDVPACA